MSLSSPNEYFAATQKSLLDTAHAPVHLSLTGLEKLNAFHLSTVRSTLLEQLDSGRELLATKDFRDLYQAGGTFAQPQIDKAIGYYRGLYDISAETREEFIKLLEDGHAEINRTISSALDGYAKSSSSSEVAVAAVKSAISAANSAFENANKAARQVAGLAEAGVAAAAGATSRAVASAAPTKVRKAA